ncbi:(Dimethylallyl)adenosine tRNA methylthiotransferase MiaB [bacterium BMS3Abin02]|nr:(Dimethylallyl)adenosine tRNA methylthiotransferase MiaB [bacterium BMS3Abin02]GBE21716.1 (Dimethylallyl)adenosine tRNA methylthiotransferase MiaB [bacterium BMS3Bbin01]HDH27088.1 tRNA (N6-isopentenyl adenosine(37)-C2)-methylthiotransferase MiaB [Actinomycetota bacterium]HDL49241.1 tRNA (N6-isopentenyl adenosine(37)-C2)-methylthiotransferase MiaB [Actinomycetota bacterium]
MTEMLLGMAVVADHAPRRAGKRYVIMTFGCQMNEHDSERVAGLFEVDGMERTSDIDEADVIFVNTCTIRENADNRLYGNLGHLKQFKDEHPEATLIVGGCAAQKDRDLVRERAPWVDVVLGTHNLDRVLDLMDVAAVSGGVTEVVDELETMPSLLPVRRRHAHSAWVTIQIGCNNTCTFCIVPSVRGHEISRRPGDIVAEIEKLAAEGVVEVTLLGQNVNTYGRDLALDGKRRPIFAELLRRVGDVEGIRRIRFTSPHPADFREDVAAAMAQTDTVCDQLHLPLQSGSDRILAAMHRGYNVERFLQRLALARSYIPTLAVSTDVIVGFPGETEQDFDGTMSVMETARFDQAFTFIFSPRPGTLAAEMKDRFVDVEVVRNRYRRLIELQNRIGLEKNRDHIGRVVEVLTEGPSKKNAAMATTRTTGNRVVHIPGEYPAGEFLNVEITGAARHHLVGAVR